MIPEQLFCQACGSSEHYTKEVGTHIGAFCSTCDKWIKWLPKGEPTFFFGKFKGMAVKDIQDKGYLEWYLNNDMRKTRRMREAVEERISQLEKLKF